MCNDSIFAFMVLCAQFPLIWYATWLFSQKYMILPFDPTPCVKGVSVEKIFATLLLQMLSALIWYATWLYSVMNIGAPPPKSTPGARTQAFKLKSRLICFISIAALPACKISAKNIDNCLSYCEIKIGGVKGGGVKLWHCHAYLQALGNHGL